VKVAVFVFRPKLLIVLYVGVGICKRLLDVMRNHKLKSTISAIRFELVVFTIISIAYNTLFYHIALCASSAEKKLSFEKGCRYAEMDNFDVEERSNSLKQ
jgi:hypothetical protein